MHSPRLVLLFCLAPFVACSTAPPPPLYDGLGNYRRSVSTGSDEARRYFDQGLILAYSFNHDEAVRAFKEAIRIDPGFAMAWWGVAYGLGPNRNLAMTDPTIAREAHRAAQRARALNRAEGRGAAPDVERALIDALTKRFANPPPKKRRSLDEAYAAAMREVWKRFPDDPDVGTLFADSLLTLRPAKQWTRDGKPRPGTEETVTALERVLAAHPDHPGANHLYIHALEASPHPEKALAACKRLVQLVPAAGHLQHMPSHIYIRTGDYAEANAANRRAIEADNVYFERAGAQRMYEIYRAHNHHFLAWGSMFQGARGQAMKAARDLVQKLPMDHLGELPRSIEAFLFVPVHVMIRFGLWEDVLAEPAPARKFPVALALWHHARAVALANTARIDEALTEAAKFERVAATIPKTKVVRRAKIKLLMDVARHMMKGEILFKQGRQEEAFAALRKAVEAEDSLPYAEPPVWMQPVRHALGALLLEAGRTAAAESVYRADLAFHARNGWSLHGLAECLRRRGARAEAGAVEARFQRAWIHADVEIAASCYCRKVD